MASVTGSWIGIGQMSGTSLDGNDLCAARFTLEEGRWEYALLQATTVPYPPDWQARLRTAPTSSAEELAKLHVDYGHYLGLLIRQFVLERGLAPDFAAVHGHTIFHQPWRQFTTQLGCGETMATHLSYPLVANFRARDVAQGGEGAPLVPFGEQALFPEAALFLNLGGIANVSLFRARLPQASFQASYNVSKPLRASPIAPTKTTHGRPSHPSNRRASARSVAEIGPNLVGSQP